MSTSVSFRDRYQSIATSLDSNQLVTTTLQTQKKYSFCVRALKLLVSLITLGLVDPYRHMRVEKVMLAIFKDCATNRAELNTADHKALVLSVLAKLGAKNPKKFIDIQNLYSSAVNGLGGTLVPISIQIPPDNSRLTHIPPPPPPPPQGNQNYQNSSAVNPRPNTNLLNALNDPNPLTRLRPVRSPTQINSQNDNPLDNVANTAHNASTIPLDNTHGNRRRSINPTSNPISINQIASIAQQRQRNRGNLSDSGTIIDLSRAQQQQISRAQQEPNEAQQRLANMQNRRNQANTSQTNLNPTITTQTTH